MGRYYNLLFISEFEDDIFFDTFKNLIKEVGINAIVHNLSDMNENLSFYDLVFFNMRKLNMDEKYKNIYNNILKCNLPIISFNGYTDLEKDKLKETVKIIEEGKEKTDLKIEKVEWFGAAFSGYISGKLFKNDKLNVIGNILMHLCRFKDVNRYYEEMKKMLFEKYILINYTKYGNKINEDDLRWNNEQIEIVVQILLNKGNKIIITSTEEENKCKEFINRFQDKNVKYIPGKDTFKLLNMINNSSMIIDMGTTVSTIASGLGKPFVSIGCDLDFLDFKSIIQEDNMFLSAFDMNVGKIISNIENINKNYNDLCIKLKNTVDKYYNLTLMFLRKVFNTVESKNKVTYEDKRKNKNNLVSIVLLAYNHLNYTKKCIESILEFTKDVNYELILVNNGSTDETKDYFDSLDNVKVVNIKENVRVCNGFNEGIFYSEGKYIACVCNDFIFTYNWLDNLIKCIESDDKIGYVSSGASSISNLQQIDLKFNNIQEMHEKAKTYNVSDPKKWEERIRLLPCVLMCRAELLKKVGGYDPVFYYGEFADDDISFRIRREGYKLVYAGDTFTYHFGSVTTKKAQVENSSLDISRKIFIDRYGIDSWIEGMFNTNICNLVRYKNKDSIGILGINTFCGGTPLQIKNIFRQKGINNVKVVNFSEKRRYIQDLKTVSDFVYDGKLENISDILKNKKFDYIILENGLEYHNDLYSILNSLYELLRVGGQIIINIFNKQYIYNLLSYKNSELELYGNGYNSSFIKEDRLEDIINQIGFKNINVVPVTNALNNQEEVQYLFNKLKDSLSLDSTRLTTYRFLISAQK